MSAAETGTLSVRGLCVRYGAAKVVRNVSLDVRSGCIVGLVGESGCGKSTLLRSLLRLPMTGAEIEHGSVCLDGDELTNLPEKEFRKIRGRRISLVFQNYDSMLSPVVTVRRQLKDTVRAHGIPDVNAAEERFCGILDRFGLHDGERILNSYSFELSGGMNQRICIALAMLLQPEFLLADEPTSALDVTVQAQVVRELQKMREDTGCGMLVSTHNMRMVSHLTDELGILYAGELVEFGPTYEVLSHPMHPYTRGLLAAIPNLDGELPKTIPGTPPPFTDNTPGCRFAPRCGFCTPVCRENQEHVTDGTHWALCPRGGEDLE